MLLQYSKRKLSNQCQYMIVAGKMLAHRKLNGHRLADMPTASTIAAISPANGESSGELLRLLLDGRPRTRSELAALSGVSRGTIAARMEPLLNWGLVRAVGEAASTGGRPPSQLAFFPGAAHLLAFDLGATHATVGIADLAGTTVDFQTIWMDIAEGPEICLDAVLDLAREVISRNPSVEATIRAVGVGLPGPVEYATGRPISPPIMPGWDRFDVREYVQRRFPLPVLVDNDVNILAVGEHTLHWPATQNLIYVKVATGIGAGLIVSGSIVRGDTGSAGDMGHVLVSPGGSSTDAPVDLEGVASGAAVARALTVQGIEAQNSRAVARLVAERNPMAIAAVRQAGRDIGEVLSTVVSILNPSVIVVGGSLGHAGEDLLAGIREVVYRRSIPLASQHLTIVQAQGGDRAGVRGAAVLAAAHVLNPAYVDAWGEQRALEVSTI